MKSLDSLSQLLWKAESQASTAPSSQQSPNPQSPLNPLRPVAPFYHSGIDDLLPEGGLLSNVLHEWYDTTHLKRYCPPLGITTTLLGNSIQQLQQRDPKDSSSNNFRKPLFWNRYLIWIGKGCWPTPHLLLQTLPHPSLLQFCLFLDTSNREKTLWALDITARSEAVYSIFAHIPYLSLPKARRIAITLREKEKPSFCFLFRGNRDRLSASQTPSLAHTKWLISPNTTVDRTPSTSPPLWPAPSWTLSLLQKKGEQPVKREWDITLTHNPFNKETSQIKVKDRSFPSKNELTKNAA